MAQQKVGQPTPVYKEGVVLISARQSYDITTVSHCSDFTLNFLNNLTKNDKVTFEFIKDGC